MKKKNILIEVSNRHVHFSKKDLEILFGKYYRLKPIRELSQPGQFVSECKVQLMNNGKIIENVKVLGPERDKTQVEILKSDSKLLGINVPERLSGDLDGSPGIKIIGTKGILGLKKGVIISKRHLHASEEEADELGIRDKEKIKIRIGKPREFILENVFVRVGLGNKLAVHIDKEEARKISNDRMFYGEII